MSVWASAVAEIQRALKIPPGKFTVKKMKGGEVLQLHVKPNYTLESQNVEKVATVATPNNRDPHGICIDFAESTVGVMYGDIKLRLFPSKLDCMQLNTQHWVDRDHVNAFIEMSDVHPVIPDLEMDDTGDCVDITSTGPLMYYFPTKGVDFNVEFQFRDKCSVLKLHQPRAKRRRFNQT